MSQGIGLRTFGPKNANTSGSAEMRTFSLGYARDKRNANRPNRENLSQTVRKQMGHLGREYANRPVRPKQGTLALREKGQRDTR
ncbi:hypothetical protein KI387_015385, partial [Taxus chinensis]